MNKLTLVFAVLITWTLSQPLAAQAGESLRWYCDEQPLVEFWAEEIENRPVAGQGLVCATPFGLWSSLQTDGLTRGNAYTVWWVYIDDPASCANTALPSPAVIPFPEPDGFAGPCGLADFFTADPAEPILNPLAVFGRMDSVVPSHDRGNRFSGSLRGFTPSEGSQVWMFLFGHGPADRSDRRQLARQLLTPEDPASGVPHLGIEGRPFGYPAAVVVFHIP